MVATTRPIGWRWVDPCRWGGVSADYPVPCTTPDAPAPGSRAGVEPDPGEAPVLVRIQLVADGGSLAAATRLFVERGHPDPAWWEVVAVVGPNALTAHATPGSWLPGHVVAEAADGHRIVSVDVWQRVQNVLGDPERRTAPDDPPTRSCPGSPCAADVADRCAHRTSGSAPESRRRSTSVPGSTT